MLDKKIIELINKDIEGLTAEDEKRYLSKYLKEHKEAEQYYNEIKASVDLLTNIKEIDPTPNLRKRILNSIDPSLYAKKETGGSLKPFIESFMFHSRSRFAFAITFVVGLLVGIFAYSIVFIDTGQYQKIDNIYGTIGIKEKTGFELVNSIPFDLPELSGIIDVSRFESLILFEVDLNTNKEIKMNLNIVPGEIKFHNFRPLNQQQYELKVADESITTATSGNTKFSIIFEYFSKTPSKIIVELLHAENLLATDEITIPVKID